MNNATGPQEPLTQAELIAIRDLLPVAKEVKKQAEYNMARRLVFQTWRQGIIGISSFIAAVYVFRDQIANFLGGR